MQILTKEDLDQFKADLFKELKGLLNQKEDSKTRFLNSNEVRELFQISETKLYELRRDGKIPFLKADGKYLYEYEEVVKAFKIDEI